jgi:hypothetical protein
VETVNASSGRDVRLLWAAGEGKSRAAAAVCPNLIHPHRPPPTGRGDKKMQKIEADTTSLRRKGPRTEETKITAPEADYDRLIDA